MARETWLSLIAENLKFAHWPAIPSTVLVEPFIGGALPRETTVLWDSAVAVTVVGSPNVAAGGDILMGLTTSENAAME